MSKVRNIENILATLYKPATLESLATTVDISGLGATTYYTAASGDLGTSRAWSIQVVWSGIGANSGTADIELSNDNSNWKAYQGFSTENITGATGTLIFADDRLACRNIRIKITKGTLAAGTLDINIYK